jgi:hypothetical protein
MDPMELELKLKRALEAQDPPDDFTDRVLKRCIGQQAAAAEERARPASADGHWSWREWLFPRHSSGWRLALAGSLMVTILGVGIGYHQHQERVRGEQARAQLMLALQITGKQLNRVHHVLIEQPGGAQE